MNQSLRIGYITTGAVADLRNWSGLVFHIRQALSRAGHEVHDLDNFPVIVPLRSRVRGYYQRFVRRRVYGYHFDPDMAHAFARQVERRIHLLRLDALVSPGTYAFSKLRTDLPCASWGDATFHGLNSYYPWFNRFAEVSVKHGEELQLGAFANCALNCYPSHWAAADALNHYHVDPRKVAVVPFGANCEPPFGSESEAVAAVASRMAAPFRMLFVGIEWERKGGPLALRILQELQRRGVSAELWIAGCEPFQGEVPAGVRCLGFLEKSDPLHQARWDECFRSCHVFVMPTRAECFGVVYAEAAAFALPSLATRTGGVPDAAREGGNGWLFDLEDAEGPYADLLEHWARNPAAYHEAAVQAWHASDSVLNWKVAGRRFGELLEEKVRLHPSGVQNQGH